MIVTGPWGDLPAPASAPDCWTCEDRTEIWTGRDEHDTGQPITTDCPDCTHQTRTSA